VIDMRKLIAFNSVTLDGYFSGENGDISWAHENSQDPEWNAFVEENAKGEGMLLFGRITYEMMAGYWTTPAASKDNPVVAKGMNNMPKVVFSRTMDNASWKNTKLVKGDIAAEVRRMKKEPGPDIAILGSGSIISQLTQHRLIDEYHVVVVPVIIGKGRTMFEGVTDKLTLKRTKTRAFRNGNVFVCYEPIT
jgi:dihydrofolate reductase